MNKDTNKYAGTERSWRWRAWSCTSGNSAYTHFPTECSRQLTRNTGQTSLNFGLCLQRTPKTFSVSSLRSSQPPRDPGSWLLTWVPRWRLAKCTSGMKRTGWVSRSTKGLKTVISIRLWEGSSGTLTSETEKEKKKTADTLVNSLYTQTRYRPQSTLLRFKKLKLQHYIRYGSRCLNKEEKHSLCEETRCLYLYYNQLNVLPKSEKRLFLNIDRHIKKIWSSMFNFCLKG